MSFKQMETYISECVKAFPTIRLVVDQRNNLRDFIFKHII